MRGQLQNPPEPQETFPFGELPLEVRDQVFQFLNIGDLATVRLVNRESNDLAHRHWEGHRHQAIEAAIRAPLQAPDPQHPEINKIMGAIVIDRVMAGRAADIESYKHQIIQFLQDNTERSVGRGIFAELCTLKQVMAQIKKLKDSNKLQEATGLAKVCLGMMDRICIARIRPAFDRGRNSKPWSPAIRAFLNQLLEYLERKRDKLLRTNATTPRSPNPSGGWGCVVS